MTPANHIRRINRQCYATYAGTVILIAWVIAFTINIMIGV